MPQGWTPVQESTAPKGWTPVANAAVPSSPPVARQERPPQPGRDFLAGFSEMVNPIPALKAMYESGRRPDGRFDAHLALKQTGRNLVASQLQQFQRAGEMYRQGRLSEATGYFLAGALPLIGPAAAHVGETAAAGEGARAMGQTAGVIAPFGVRAGQGRALTVPSPFRNRVPAERAAVAFAGREGIPIEAGTATGNPVVRGLQWATERTIPGSVIGEKGRALQATALTTTGERLAGRIHPTPTSPELAGAGVRTAVQQTIARYHAEADTAYARLRQPDVLTARVNLEPIQTALRPLYERLKHRQTVAPLEGAEARALHLLDDLEQLGTDAPPTTVRPSGMPPSASLATVADAELILGRLKAFSRRLDQPELRTRAQGTARATINALQHEIDRTVAAVNPQALGALHQGRVATWAKYLAGEVLETLSDEPVRTFRGVVMPHDAALTHLRDLQRLAPQELPTIGRAYLEDLLTLATVEGQFGHGAGLFQKWQSLGPQTKAALFGEVTKDLDQFFLVAKKIAENPNPSGSAFVVGIGAQGAILITNPGLGVTLQLSGYALAKALRAPRVVRLLTEGLRLPVTNKTAAVALTNQVISLLPDDTNPGPE